MAINFVRKPSETPNVRNIDDIIPFRYAYGNQNGYVKDKGNELSYTINGSNFRINSGRVVLQGVESDIDANGVTITIENTSTLTYYVLYYRVNLATNTTSIESESSTSGYPTISSGDDLTANTSGSANLVLYKFTAVYGVISNISKIVQQVKYIKDVVVDNSVDSTHAVNADEANHSTNATNAILNNNGTYSGFTRDANGILKIGNIIIPQKKVILSGNNVVNPGQTSNELPFSENINVGDTLELTLSIYVSGTPNSLMETQKFTIVYDPTHLTFGGDVMQTNVRVGTATNNTFTVTISESVIQIYLNSSVGSGRQGALYKVVKVIE